jgi:hypothetical protein
MATDSNGYTYSYDAEGNRTFKFNDAGIAGVLDSGDSDITSYTWDYRNRLTQVSHFDDWADYSAATPVPDKVVAYAYDFANRLVRETVDSDGATGSDDVAQTAYVYDGTEIVLQFEKSDTGSLASTDLAHRDLWGPTVDQLLAQENIGSSSSETLWALTDHQNSVRDLAVYDTSGQTPTTAIVEHRVYDAFGNRTNPPTAAVDCVFGYTGRMFDEATGQQYNLNRWYE